MFAGADLEEDMLIVFEVCMRLGLLFVDRERC
jgi:hypothetical protein